MGAATLIGRSPIPPDWQFSPEFMTPIIARQHPGARVSAVRMLDGSDGTCSRARFGLEYSEGAGPATVFAKSKGDLKHRILQLMTGNWFIEARLFGTKIPLPLEYPAVYHTVLDRLRINELIVMEDLSHRNVVLNDATRPLSVDDVANGLQGLARLHSSFWRFSNSTHPKLEWVQPCKATRTFQWLMKFGWDRGLARLKDCVPEQIVSFGAERMVACWAQYLRSVSKGPMTLLHGDAHVGNTYLVPDGDLGFLDWATVRRGNWAYDVGYFIISALDVADRRSFARDLIEQYRNALDVPAEDRPSSDEAWLRFRTTPAYGLPIWVATGAEDGFQSPLVCSNLVNRFGTAFLDLDTPAALTSLG